MRNLKEINLKKVAATFVTIAGGSVIGTVIAGFIFHNGVNTLDLFDITMRAITVASTATALLVILAKNRFMA